MDRLTRRRFLRALSAGGALYAMGQTPGTVMAQASAVDGFSDYKALVCVFLIGGNDSWSMLVPSSDAEYAAYAASRQNLAISRDSLLPVNALDTGEVTYGMHPSMPGFQSLFEAGRCAAIANVGPLIEPVTLEQYQAGTAALPPQLFSHNDQQNQWYTLAGPRLQKSGWAGRIADILAEQTLDQQLALNISLSGRTLCQAGEAAIPYVMGATGSAFTGLGDTAKTVARRVAFERLVAESYADPYARAFADVQDRALKYSALVSSALATAPALSTPFANSALSIQLKTVARMIAVRERLGMSRQIFFVAAGGFDTHDRQLVLQPGLLSDVSASLTSFHNATEELGVAANVTAFTHSDFGRTLTSNGDGSDHGWGGVQFVIGGAIKGQTLYGQYPRLEIGGPDDVGGGRMIPAVSSDQYVATLATWFGVAPEFLPLVSPSIGNFAEQDLGFFNT